MQELLEMLQCDMRPEVAGRYLALAADYFDASRGGAKPVPASPEVLARLVAEPPPECGSSTEEVIERLRRDVLPNSNWLYHPRCIGHQVSPPLPAAIWVEALTAALNQSVAVAEMSPIASAVESSLLRWMAGLAGFGAEAGGVFTSGGTEATFTALLAARAAALPDSWEHGVGSGAVVLTGEHSHYSVSRAVAELGLGARNCVALPASAFRDDTARLARELDRLAGAGRKVLAVVATSGSTATGRFDDLDAIGRLCVDRSVWMHVDGCHGASALLSPTHSHRLGGLHRANSLSWDPHKMMLMPLSTSAVLVRDERLLDSAFAQRAPYLFHAQGESRVRDQGVRSFQCSRRADALKLWVALQRYGTRAFGLLYDHLCATAAAIYSAVRRRLEFEVGPDPECNILCFRYVGDSRLDDDRLDALNLALRSRLNSSGQGWITATRLYGRQYLRMTVMNPRTRAEDGEAVLDALSAAAQK